MIKRIISVFLSVVLIIALASSAMAATSSFPDIRDDTLAREVAVLQMLGVISGDGNGNFDPNGSLTRAAFCKMAVIAMGRGEEEALYRNRTIFPDVRAGHWARGFINIAVSGDKRIIVGYPDGTFRPDSDITYGQAVAILIKVLGYTDADAGMLFPDGYLALAKDAGLTDGLPVLASGGPITRAQAAHLFFNLLGTNVKGGGSYISKLGTASESVVIMALDVRASDGSAGAIRTSEGIFKTVSGVVPPSILGLRGTLLKNASGKVLTFLPDENKQPTITAALVSASWIKDTAGIRYDISPEAIAFTASDSDKYGNAFVNIAAGMKVTLFYSADGIIEGVYINTSKSGGAIVAGTEAIAGFFSTLTGGDTGYTILKNGAPATLADIKQYDVITYDKAARVLNVTDFRLTGCYENCWPNMTSPSKITLMGKEFTVLPSAIESLANFKIGQVITLLFTSDLQVAGAVASSVSSSTAIGFVQPGLTATSATVRLLNGIELKGNPQLQFRDGNGNLQPDEMAISKLQSSLVIVSSYTPGYLTLSSLNKTGVSGDIDLLKLTLGTAALSPAIRIFERVGAGVMTQISLSELTQVKISASKVLYAGVDYAGRIDTLVLNDVTGDRYTYGFLKEDVTTEARTLAVRNSGDPNGTTAIRVVLAVSDGAPGGVVLSADGTQVETIITLTEVKNVSRSSFTTVNGQVYAHLATMDILVSKDVQCYNKLNNTWFTSLNDARAFSEMLTVYYDRAPSDGGKIRMIIAG